MKYRYLFCLAVITLFMASVATANSTLWGDFESAYPQAVGTRIDNCKLCHSTAPALNSYGSAWVAASYSFTAIEGTDTDGDGFSNLAEINAHTYPGNAADKPVAVPDVVGQTQAAASTAITGAGLVVGIITQQYSNTVPSGSVISQTPTAGSLINAGASVALALSQGPAPVIVPNVVGQTQAAASTAITGAGLVVGTITQQYSATVPAGNVISQTPTAGTSVSSGSSVALVVSKGPHLVTVPDVVGQSQADASTAITGAGLIVGTIAQEYSATVPSGNVISQDPPAGSTVNEGSAVTMVISKGPEPVEVPNVVGQTQTDAVTAITEVGLVVGSITEEYNLTVPAGSIISQFPLAGSLVPPATSVDLTISKGPAIVSVPDVVGLTTSQANAAIAGAGLLVGPITLQVSATVPVGSIISQTPLAGTDVPMGTAVSLVVSQAQGMVLVPNVVGMTQSAASTEIVGASLSVGTVTQAYSATIPAGSVISQSPLAGQQASSGTFVSLVISKGPELVTVANYVGQSLSASSSAILNAGLTLGAVTQEYSATLPLGEVISQTPVAGSQVLPLSSVALVVSKGPAPVTVPDVVGHTQTEAASAVTDAGLVVGVVTQQYSATVPWGSVISQTPIAGDQASLGSSVALVVSSGPPPVTVPDVVGQTQTDAGAALTGVGLVVGTVAQEYSPTIPAGKVVTQTPASGTQALAGSSVALVVSLGLAPVAVPSVVGQILGGATATITGVGLVVGTVKQEFSSTVPLGSVISQNPIAASQVPLASAVDLVVSKGPAPILVPTMIGLPRTQAESIISSNGLAVGTVTEQSSSVQPAGRVISQNPLGGTLIPPATAVNLVVSSGPPVTHAVVPNVVGSIRVSVEAAITGVGLTVGTEAEQYSDTVPAGRIISQDPVSGTQVVLGTTINLTISLGPAPPNTQVKVPDVSSLSVADAAEALASAGLTIGQYTNESSDTVPMGVIVRLDPPVGTELVQGSIVNVVISAGPASTASGCNGCLTGKFSFGDLFMAGLTLMTLQVIARR